MENKVWIWLVLGILGLVLITIGWIGLTLK